MAVSEWTGKDATARPTRPQATRSSGGGGDSRPDVDGPNDNMDEIVINAPAGHTPASDLCCRTQSIGSRAGA
ncbi:hypothetical protein [Streptomyces bungoensis]|uniref:hypothetical protein n=1 Tax=Streptomyces bungoensis TaxID=285568 RepID=UPI0033CF17D7